MARRSVIGVMGAGEGASLHDLALAEELGRLVAAQGWALLTGGRDAGVMRAASRGAKSVAGSLVIGVLPSESGPVASDVDVAIFTGLGHARNAVNVLSSDVVVACGVGGPGTGSESALALKMGHPLILLAPSAEARAYFGSLGGVMYVASEPREVVDLIVSRGLL
ncbi:MAG: cytochrome [Gemmatimonadaceae bacterium]